MSDDLYIAFYRGDDYLNAQEAFNAGALYISSSNIDADGSTLFDALTAISALEDCLGSNAELVFVDASIPTKYFEERGNEILSFRQGEFWDTHSEHVKELSR